MGDAPLIDTKWRLDKSSGTSKRRNTFDISWIHFLSTQ